jgi:hypothetical protein
MPSITSNLFVDEQQVVVVATATTQLEQETIVAATLTWEKKTIACHLEQQFAVAQGIAVPQDDDNDHSIDTGSNPDATLAAHLHAQAAGIQNI